MNTELTATYGVLRPQVPQKVIQKTDLNQKEEKAKVEFQYWEVRQKLINMYESPRLWLFKKFNFSPLRYLDIWNLFYYFEMIWETQTVTVDIVISTVCAFRSRSLVQVSTREESIIIYH